MADRYWVGGTGNWDASTTTNWSATSGGAGGASVPTSADNVIFNSASNATAYTVTITATANCLDFTMAGPLVGAVTWAGSSAALNIYGSMSLSGTAGITRTFGGNSAIISFLATSGTRTITTNGVTIDSPLVFNGSGGTFQLADNFTFNASNSACNTTLTAGTFDPNGKTVTYSGFIGGTTITGAFTFFNLTFDLSGHAVKTDKVSFASNITVSGTLTITGNSVINRFLVQSNTKGTARTITAAAISVDKVDFQDITGAGAASWNMSAAAGYTGDCGGNTMQALGSAAFTTAATCNWSAGATWSTATWSSRVPLPQDTATFTTAGVATITQDMPRIGSVDFSTSSNKTWTTSTACSVFGSINLTNLATLTSDTQTYTFEGRGSNTLNSGGFTWAKSITLNAPSGTLTLSSNISSGTSRTLDITSGTFNSSSFNVSFGFVSSSSSTTTRTINLGSGTWSITGSSSTIFNINSTATITAGTSIIKITDTGSSAITFAGGGKTYNNVWFSRGASTASNTISGSNTFADFKDDGSVAHSILFTAGTTQTVTTFTVNGTAGQEITLNSTTTATHALVKSGGGTITCNYLNIQHSVATPGSTWTANNSTNNQSVATAGSGWSFGGVANTGSGFFMCF